MTVFLSSFQLLYFHVRACVHLSVSSLTADQNTHSAWGAFCNLDFFFFKPWLIPKQQIAAVAGVAPHRWSSITSWGGWQDQSRSSFARSQLSHVSFDRSHGRNNSRHCLGGKYCDQTKKNALVYWRGDWLCREKGCRLHWATAGAQADKTVRGAWTSATVK